MEKYVAPELDMIEYEVEEIMLISGIEDNEDTL